MIIYPARLCLTLAVIFLPVGGSKVVNANEDIPHYEIRVDADARQAEVRVAVPSGATRLFMDSVQAQHLPDGWATFVANLSAQIAGKTVTLERTGPVEWRLPAKAPHPFTFTYRVNLRFTAELWPAGNEQAGARFDDALYIVGRALFIDTDAPGSRRVSFELPANWRASAPWRPIANSPLTFAAHDGTDLVRNSLVLGRHASIQVNTGSVRT